MGKFPRIASAALIGLVLAFPVLGAENTSQALFIKSLADQAFQLLSDNSISLEERESRFRELLKNGFAMKTIGRFVVGRHWRKMSPAQQSEYLDLFSDWTVKIYSSRLGGYSGQSLEILKTVNSTKKDVFVRTQINLPGGGKPIICDFRVRDFNGELKIVDIGIEGISMLVTQKAEFGALLKKRGVVGLIEMLRARNSKFPAVSG